MLTFAIGDVHGCAAQLKTLVGQCVDYANDAKQPFKFVFVGDYVDRGPDSKSVLDYLIDFPYEKVCLMGNHEDMLLAQSGDWYRNGGNQTNASYPNKRVSVEHREFIRRLPLIHQDEHRIYVHAGLAPDIEELSDQVRIDMLWIRDEFLNTGRDWGKLVVHGHTPYHFEKSGMQWGKGKNRLNLDTACVFGGELTAAVFDDKERNPKTFLQVHNVIH